MMEIDYTLNNNTLLKKATVKYMINKYGLSVDHIYALRTKGIDKNLVFIENDKVYVNEYEFNRRKEFANKVAYIAEQHFFLLNRYFNVSEIAWMLHKIDPKHNKKTWISFMRDSLFAFPDSSILKYKIPTLRWKFFRYTRWILIHIFKLGGYKYENICIRDLNYKLAELDEKKENDNGTSVKEQ